MSQEDPTIVVTPVQRDIFVGGAGIVAAHARGLGAQVNYFTVAGQDATADYARKQLSEYGVNATIIEDASRPTTLKQRWRARNKTLLRVSQLKQHDLNHELQIKIFNELEKALADSNLVIFSDFNYGCLPQDIVDSVVNFCKRKNILMVADSQSSSQVGDISRFKGMGLVTPTEREARLATRDWNSGLVVLAEKLRVQAEAKTVIVTMGAEGLLIHGGPELNGVHQTDQLPAFNTAPKDPAGAGDSLLTCASMSMALGCDIWQSAYLGSIAAACQVGRVGNIPLTQNDLITEIEEST
jgi:rfaE bifunctional protein kinase chain/domain